MPLTRRHLLQSASTLAAGAILSGCAFTPFQPSGAADWRDAERIVQSIRPVAIPSLTVEASAFGLPASGSGDARAAIQSAIDEAHAAGGGRVIVPAGLWLSDGPIRFRSNVELHLSEGSHIRFLPNPERYLPAVFTRWEGVELFTYSPMVYGEDCENIALTGRGILDGQGKKFWLPWRQTQEPTKAILRDMGRDGVPVAERVFIGERRLRPHFVQFNRCRRVLVDGPTLMDSPFWMVHPLYCEDVVVRNLTCISNHINSDGVDPDSSRRVLIENCDFDVGDDGVSIKAGRDQDGWRVGCPSEDVVVRNCVYSGKTGGALAIGSEMSGGVRNVFVDGFRMKTARHTLFFKANLDRGGQIRDVFIRNIEAEDVHSILVFSNDYHSYRGGTAPTDFRDVHVEAVRVRKAVVGISIQGNRSVPVRNIQVRDMQVDEVTFPLKTRFAEAIGLENVTMNGRAVTLAQAVDVDTDLIGN